MYFQNVKPLFNTVSFFHICNSGSLVFLYTIMHHDDMQQHMMIPLERYSHANQYRRQQRLEEDESSSIHSLYRDSESKKHFKIRPVRIVVSSQPPTQKAIVALRPSTLPEGLPSHCASVVRHKGHDKNDWSS